MRRVSEAVVAGEHLVLLPERAIYWSARKALLVADVHLGKDSAFRSLGIPVGPETTQSTLDRLTCLVEETTPEELWVLGDLWHAKVGRTPAAVDAFLRWREAHEGLQMTLIEGNHDRRSGALPPEANMGEVSEPYVVGPFGLCHYPDVETSAYRLAGHIHPSVVLQGPARQALRLPCFIFGPEGGLLPAFGDFTGTAVCRPTKNDQVFVIGENRVFAVN